MPFNLRALGRLVRVGLCVVLVHASLGTAVAADRSTSKKRGAEPPARKASLPPRVNAQPVRKQAAPKVARAAEPRANPGKAPRPNTATQAGRLVRASFVQRPVAPPRLSIGNSIGLHLVDDPLDLRSSVAYIQDAQSGETLYEKNPDAVLPIASITKLMTAMVVLDARLPLEETIEIADADRDTERFSSSRLAIGARLSRDHLLHLALMSSENRAAHALGRTYPGGLAAFVEAMNDKARAIGMTDSRFADPTGLSSNNRSSARDLARMVRVANGYPLIRDYSTSTSLVVDTGSRQMTYRTTNRLVDRPDWNISLQKTGYISEAGKCLVMQATIEGRPVVLVLLDAAGTQSRFADAQRLRKWLAQRFQESGPAPESRS